MKKCNKNTNNKCVDYKIKLKIISDCLGTPLKF